MSRKLVGGDAWSVVTEPSDDDVDLKTPYAFQAVALARQLEQTRVEGYGNRESQKTTCRLTLLY